MPELVTIPASFFELAVDYERPVFRSVTDRGPLVQGIFDALRPWNPSVDDIEIHDEGKYSQQGVTIHMPVKRASFFFGITSCRFSCSYFDWSVVDENLRILDTAVSTFAKLADVEMTTKRTTLGLHIQSRTIGFKEILSPFLSTQLASLDSAPFRTMAVVARWARRGVTLDQSLVHANAVFAKLEREFEGACSYLEMIQQLRSDNDELFRILGVEEERA